MAGSSPATAHAPLFLVMAGHRAGHDDKERSTQRAVGIMPVLADLDPYVMAGLDLAISVSGTLVPACADSRVKPGYDEIQL